MILMIDNFDSFTFNIVQAAATLGETIVVKRNNAVSLAEIKDMKPEGIIISPGPGAPKSAGISLDVIRSFYEDIPIFGVCLGHQCIYEAFGGRIIHAKSVMHGKLSTVMHDGTGLFKDLPQTFRAVRYHSLSGDTSTLPPDLRVCALSDDGEIMGIAHRKYPVYGVQFHPESIATENGVDVIRGFTEIAHRRDS
jgi:anthranilate synthase/aminodeoxychorismate synthase-like glutamine amidotransferase